MFFHSNANGCRPARTKAARAGSGCAFCEKSKSSSTRLRLSNTPHRFMKPIMKTFAAPLAVLFALNFSALADMIIVQKVEGAGQLGEMTMKFKGDKVRADVSPEISTITDSKTGDVMTIMHAQKTYMKIPASSTKALMEQMKKSQTQSENGAANPAPKLSATGKKDKINGYNTDEYTAALGGMTVHYWIAKDFPKWSTLLAQMLKMQQGGLAAMTKGMA